DQAHPPDLRRVLRTVRFLRARALRLHRGGTRGLRRHSRADGELLPVVAASPGAPLHQGSSRRPSHQGFRLPPTVPYLAQAQFRGPEAARQDRAPDAAPQGTELGPRQPQHRQLPRRLFTQPDRHLPPGLPGAARHAHRGTPPDRWTRRSPRPHPGPRGLPQRRRAEVTWCAAGCPWRPMRRHSGRGRARRAANSGLRTGGAHTVVAPVLSPRVTASATWAGVAGNGAGGRWADICVGTWPGRTTRTRAPLPCRASARPWAKPSRPALAEPYTKFARRVRTPATDESTTS